MTVEMFTGLIEEVGAVERIAHEGGAARIVVEAPGAAASAKLGDSIAVNGVCLTAVAIDGGLISFDAVPETLARSSLGSLRAGSKVNLEQALVAGARLGGHFVQGHVDGVGRILAIREEGNARVVTISAPAELMRYMVLKGSVALDGISLTLAEVGEETITVWIVPHTWTHTNLSDRRPGDPVNIEADLIARHVEKLLAERADGGGFTEDLLMAEGFIN